MNVYHQKARCFLSIFPSTQLDHLGWDLRNGFGQTAVRPGMVNCGYVKALGLKDFKQKSTTHSLEVLEIIHVGVPASEAAARICSKKTCHAFLTSIPKIDHCVGRVTDVVSCCQQIQRGSLFRCGCEHRHLSATDQKSLAQNYTLISGWELSRSPFSVPNSSKFNEISSVDVCDVFWIIFYWIYCDIWWPAWLQRISCSYRSACFNKHKNMRCIPQGKS